MDRWLTIAGVGETGPQALSEPVKTALGNASLIVAAPRFHAALVMGSSPPNISKNLNNC